MKSLKILFISFTALIVGQSVYSQQSPLFSQYMVNKFLINPAVAGGNGYTNINMVAREQYTGFKNAPRTFAISAQSRLLNDSYIMKKLRIRKNANQATRFTNVGIGGSIFSDRNGIVTKTGFQFAYAYHINFNNRFQLSMGLSGSGYQYKLDDSNAVLANSDDPVLLGNKKQFWVPDATFGVYLTDNQWYTGATITDIFGSGLKLGSDPLKDNFSSLRNYIFLAGSKFNLDDNFKIEPSLLLRTTSMETRLDINTKVYYVDNYWMGLSYRSDKTIVCMVGVNMDIFHFAYAYDASFGSVKTYGSGSHELMLGVRFGDNNTRRFRWIKKDQMEFDM